MRRWEDYHDHEYRPTRGEWTAIGVCWLFALAGVVFWLVTTGGVR